jgi:hypothetical protein
MRYQFLISHGAQEDLHECRRQDRYAAARITALLREVLSDQVACEALIDDREYDSAIDSVVPLASLHDRRINAYRVRMVEVGAWRLITAVDHRRHRIALLGVMPRADNYEENTDLWARIEQEYDGLDFPRY